MIAMLFLLLSMASAATYNATMAIDIPLNPPPSGAGAMIDGYVSGIVDSGFPKDVTVTSTWSKMKCRVDGEGNAYVYVTGSNSTWPTSIPSPATPTCTYVTGGDTYILTITVSEGEDKLWLPSQWHGFTTGWEVDVPNDWGKELVYVELPDEGPSWTYTPGVYRAKKSGSNWDAVWCEVQETDGGDYHWLIMRVWPSQVTEGTGTCKIKRSGAADYTVPVDIDITP